MNSTYQVIDKIKKIIKKGSTKDVALALNMDYNTLRNRCSRNSMPYEQVLRWCYESGVSIEELMFK